MTINYRVFYPDEPKDPRTIEVDSFDDFRSWLKDMGVGGDAPTQDIISGWATLYRRLVVGNLDIVNLAISFKERTGTLEIYGK